MNLKKGKRFISKFHLENLQACKSKMDINCVLYDNTNSLIKKKNLKMLFSANAFFRETMMLFNLKKDIKQHLLN